MSNTLISWQSRRIFDYMLEINDIVIIGGILIIGVVSGFLLQKAVIDRLRKYYARKRKTSSRTLLNAIRGLTIFWTLLISIVVVNNLYNDLIPGIDGTRILEIVFIFSLIYAFRKIMKEFLAYYTRTKKLPKTSIFDNVSNLVVFLLAIFVVLTVLQIDINPFLTTIGIGAGLGALTLALALQDTMTNLFAGIVIIASKQINQGDYVRLQTGEEGYIADINWKNTIIRTLQQNIVIIPNKTLSSVVITNFSLPEKDMNIKLQIGVAYDSNLDKVEDVTKEVAKEIIEEFGGNIDFEPKVRFHTFSDFSINFSLILRIEDFEQQFATQHNLIKRLHKRYKEEGIEIPFPIRTIINKN